MNKQDTINKIKIKINEVEKYVLEKNTEVDDETKEKIIKIKDRTIAVMNNAINKVEETVDNLTDNTNLREFYEKVITKCDEATSFTINKIESLLNNTNYERKTKTATKHVQDSFDDFMNNDEIKEILTSIKGMANSAYNQFNDYMAKPETKESINNAKKTTIKLAEKGLDALKNILKVEE